MNKNTTIVVVVLAIGLPLLCVMCGGVTFLLLMPSMGKAREAANRVRLMSQMKQVDLAVSAYAIDKGRLPAKLDDVQQYTGGSFDKLMTNPVTGEKPCFVYQPPAGVTTMSQVQDPSRTPLLYTLKDGQIDPNGPVGFADAHVDPRLGMSP